MNKLAMLIVIALILPLAAYATWTQYDIYPNIACGNTVAAGDIDNDGDMDIVSDVGGTLSWSENQGGTWENHIILDEVRISNVVVGDLDGDGDPDVVAMTDYPAEKIQWWENDNADFTLHYVAEDFDGGYELALGDVNADGLMDVISVAWSPQNVAWFENSGNDFIYHQLPTPPVYLHSVSAGDLDGNGTLDLVVGSGNNDEIKWYDNDGTGTFVRRDLAENIDYSATVRIVDIDQDGDNDVAVAASDGDRVVVLTNDGNANFARTTLGDLDRAWDLSAGRLGHDGDLGLAAVSREGNIVCWKYDDGEFTQRYVDFSFGSVTGVCMADIDGDGDDDVIAISENVNGLAWWEQPDVLEPPEVELDVDPVNPPLVVPQGGAFSYTLSVVSHLQESMNTYLWAMAEVQDQIFYVPNANVHFHITPTTEFSFTITQNVPQTAIPGDYEYRMKIGPSRLYSYFSNSFNLTVVEADEEGSGTFGWSLQPWTKDMFVSGDAAKGVGRAPEFAVSEAYPNPFNANTRIEFSLPEARFVTARVYDSLGRQVADVAAGQYSAGQHELSFRLDEHASGVYFLQVNAGQYQSLQKVVYLK